MRKNSQAARLTITAITASLYIALTLALMPISFHGIQFRIAEILNLMAFIDPIYGVGVILGCLISNAFSPLGPIDMIVGTLGTALAVFAVTRTKNLFIASLWPMAANTLVAFELTYVFHDPLWFSLATVWCGEFVVVTCVGYPLFRILMQNERLMALLHPLEKK